jgi:fimbrial chaperone protein
MMRLLLICCLSLVGIPLGWAQGLVVAPTRIILEPNQRTTEAAVSNFTGRTVRYRITLDDLAMGPDGITKLVSGSFPYSVKPLVRYMPKAVTLAPGQRQTIRIMATRPADLPPGDYHSHLVLNEISNPTPVTPTTISSTQARTAQGFAVNIDFTYTTGVPLSVQVGEVSSSLSLNTATLVKNKAGEPVLQLTATRTGNAEAAALLRGTVAGQAAFMPRMVRLYRELSTATLTQTFAPEALGKLQTGAPLVLEWLDGTDRKTVRQTLLVHP